MVSGAIAQLFLYPPALGGEMRKLKRKRRAYIIRNSFLGRDWSTVERVTLDIAGRAISTMINMSSTNDLFRIYMITRRDGVDYNLRSALLASDVIFSIIDLYEPFYRKILKALSLTLAGFAVAISPIAVHAEPASRSAVTANKTCDNREMAANSDNVRIRRMFYGDPLGRTETPPPPALRRPQSVAVLATGPAAPAKAGSGQAAQSGLSKEQKVLLLNVGVAAGVTTYGIAYWDYFQSSPKASSEGWFGRTTSEGGMDKLGHLWSSYSVAHLYSYVYRWWDFDHQTANTLGALSSLGIQTAIELGDAFSGDYGFSYEDAIMNVIGAGAAYIHGRYPSLARTVDFRLEYKPGSLSDLTGDILTDYENQRYLVALKLDGFDMFHDTSLSYLELHAGYQARGYDGHRADSDGDDRRRAFYFGVGLNVSKLVQKYVNFGAFDYLQVPYTSVGVTSGID